MSHSKSDFNSISDHGAPKTFIRKLNKSLNPSHAESIVQQSIKPHTKSAARNLNI